MATTAAAASSATETSLNSTNSNNLKYSSSPSSSSSPLYKISSSGSNGTLSSNSNSSNSNNNNVVIGVFNDSANYSLADVYDDAAVIGSELEKIISNYGSDVLKDLMPKVISVLELLENLTIKKEKENDELNELRMRINSLEFEKAQRINEREKFEKELEEIEEKWKQETLKLIGMVNKLKDENKRLNDSLDQNNLNSKQNDQLVIKQEELDYIRQIKEENIKLKDALRFKDREIDQKNTECEGLQSQIDNLATTILNLRRKQILAQNQIEKMVKAKAELECAVTEKEHQLNLIREKLNLNSRSAVTINSEGDVVVEEETKSPTQSEVSTTSSNSSQDKLATDLTNLLIYDSKDPNRPRFTLKELQKVLMEKNELTVKLDQTQDELEQLRRQETLNYGEVQGPINKEPDEKLDPSNKNQSNTTSTGIRRFFNFFFSTGNSANGSQNNISGNNSSNGDEAPTNTENSATSASSIGHVFIA